MRKRRRKTRKRRNPELAMGSGGRAEWHCSKRGRESQAPKAYVLVRVPQLAPAASFARTRPAPFPTSGSRPATCVLPYNSDRRCPPLLPGSVRRPRLTYVHGIAADTWRVIASSQWAVDTESVRDGCSCLATKKFHGAWRQQYGAHPLEDREPNVLSIFRSARHTHYSFIFMYHATSPCSESVSVNENGFLPLTSRCRHGFHV